METYVDNEDTAGELIQDDNLERCDTDDTVGEMIQDDNPGHTDTRIGVDNIVGEAGESERCD